MYVCTMVTPHRSNLAARSRRFFTRNTAMVGTHLVAAHTSPWLETSSSCTYLAMVGTHLVAAHTSPWGCAADVVTAAHRLTTHNVLRLQKPHEQNAINSYRRCPAGGKVFGISSAVTVAELNAAQLPPRCSSPEDKPASQQSEIVAKVRV